MRITIIALLTFAVSLMAETLDAEILIEEETKVEGPGSDEPMIIKSRIYVSADKVMVDRRINALEPEYAMSYDHQLDTLTVINHRKKIFDRISRKEMISRLESLMMIFSQALLSMPPEDRKRAMEYAGLNPQDTKPEKFVSTGEFDYRNGYQCARYDFLYGDVKVREYCVTGWEYIDPSGQAQSVMEGLGRFITDMKRPAEFNVMKYSEFELRSYIRWPFAALKELDGFPIARKTIGGKASNISEVVLISSVQLNEDFFQPPSGYQQKEIFLADKAKEKSAGASRPDSSSK
ncbi:hypothetical protein QSV34_11335 [Porticoccus sp. W117]|uniref:hypothetical protein n=1 Tax=Porticoccus sp. W117 TaxID=3054777 RepID=UPI00259719DF|nr:hypothetical protein [Porticoccus sp. W117]MDM3871939.1 hypothetical protein [Porticoccus sp. W117]